MFEQPNKNQYELLAEPGEVLETTMVEVGQGDLVPVVKITLGNGKSVSLRRGRGTTPIEPCGHRAVYLDNSPDWQAFLEEMPDPDKFIDKILKVLSDIEIEHANRSIEEIANKAIGIKSKD